MRRVMVWTALIFAGAGLLLLALGIFRYGGPEGLLLRVRAEIASYQPRPKFVPTPLPTRTIMTLLVHPSPTEKAMLTAANPTEVAVSPPSLTPSQPPISPTARPSSQPLSTPSASPTATHTLTPSPTETTTPAHLPAAPGVELTGFTHYWQTWNNCGPASLAMDLSYFGRSLTQADVGDVLRPNSEDKHVGAEELAAYARAQGFNALVRVNGSADRLRLLLSNGMPVILATWHVDGKGTGMGHYRVVTGYDDARREWILFDSLETRGVSADKPYVGVRLSYDELEKLWAVRNRVHVMVYTDDLAPAVLSIVGDEMDDEIMWQRSLQVAQEEVEQRPDDAFAWFTLGTNLLAQEQWEQAAAAYDRARIIGLPYRMLWYQFGPFGAYYETGRYEEMIALADATLEVTTDVEELHYWKGRGLQALGDLVGACQSYERALIKNPNYSDPAAALAALGG